MFTIGRRSQCANRQLGKLSRGDRGLLEFANFATHLCVRESELAAINYECELQISVDITGLHEDADKRWHSINRNAHRHRKAVRISV